MLIFNNDVEKYHIKEFNVENVINNKYCVFDFEATGLDSENEYITQIGAVIVEDLKINYSNVFKSYVKSPKPIPAFIEKLTSIRNDNIQTAPTFLEIYKDFKCFVGDSILVAQCGFEFDFNLLKQECYRNNLENFNNIQVDTKVLFGAMHRELDVTYSTDFLLKNYQIYSKDVQRHDALGDSILVARILIEILNEYKENGITSINLESELKIKKFIPKPLPTTSE